MSQNIRSILAESISAHCEAAVRLQEQSELLASIADCMTSCLRSGGKIIFCGNGGSAADSQHLAAEFVGRFRRERRGLPAIALTTDTSILTAVANDYGYNAVFSRQVEALGRSGDILFGISTSGNSPNVVAALQAGRDLGMVTVGFTGPGGGKMARLTDHLLAVAAPNTARAQEMHLLAGHVLCDWVDIQWVQQVAGVDV